MILMRAVLYVFFFSILLTDLAAQEPILPRSLTPEEEKAMAEYIRQKHAEAIRSIPIPPQGQVRTMAEWEEIQALVITWAGHQTILREITRHAVKECKVLIITNNPDNVTTQLTNANIPLDSVQFVVTPYNSIWIRDYGPWTVYKNDVDSLWLVDWIYNRPRPLDDATPTGIAQHLNLPIYEATTVPYDWIHTGGNHLPDGMGTAFSSMLVLEENPTKTEAQIDSIANVFLGVNQYIKFPTLPHDGIHHLDMHMRMIDEETIFFGQYPEGMSDGPQIEANINYLTEEFHTAFGRPYQILRLPMPPDQNGRYPSQGGHYRTYTNSIFVNKTILVPTYEERYDTTALRIYREHLPGYNVVGINCNSIISSLGALHCIAKTVGTDDPLWIAHPRLRDSEDAMAEYPVVATIRHRSGIAEASLYYRSSTDSLYTEVEMLLIDTAANIWSSLIPAHEEGSEIQYYIHARAGNGKEQVRPIVAPDGYFRFRILGEPTNVPPQVTILSPADGNSFPSDLEILPITFEASDADGQILQASIFINGELLATVDDPVLPYTYDWSFSEEGLYELVVEVIDDDGAAAVSDTIHFTIEGITALEAIQAGDVFRLYPNPVRDVLWIRWHDVTMIPVEVEVYNSLGQLLSLSNQVHGTMMEVDFANLSHGMYVVRIFTGGQMQGFKVFKN